MASLHCSSGGVCTLAFHYAGQRHHRSLEISNRKDAMQQKAVVERTLQLLKEGVLTLPDGATTDQLWQFLRSGGKLASLPRPVKSRRLAAVCDA